MLTERQQATPRQAGVVNEWLEAAIDAAIADAGEVRLPDLVRAQVVRLKADTALFAAYCEDYAYQSLYAKAVQLLSKRRDARVIHEVPDEGATPARVPPTRGTWLDRIDHSGERYLRLGDMYKPDLLASADEDEAHGLPLLMKAGLKRKLAEQLPEGKTVREVYNDDQIGRWARLLHVHWKVSIPVPAKRNPAPPPQSAEEVAD